MGEGKGKPMEKILIWGTGKIASEVWHNGPGAEVAGFIETKKKREQFYGITVYGAGEEWPEYDYIVVANDYSNEIYETCVRKNICMDKLIFLRHIKKRAGQSGLETVHRILGEKNYTNYCAEYGLYEESFFGADCKEYRVKNTRNQFEICTDHFWPVLTDKYKPAGMIANYFWQDLWAARLIHQSGVKSHLDIGSRIDGFIAHLLAMDLDVTLIDIREFPVKIEKLRTIIDDATMLRQIPEGSVESMSALCSLEHFGLGRYGDPIDPEACFKCFEQIQKRMKTGGNLYLSVPVGKERVEFNAHRIFYPSTVTESFKGMKLIEYSCAAEGKIERNVDIHKYDFDMHNGEYRYGLFYFKKL